MTDNRELARQTLTHDFTAQGILGEVKDMEAAIDAYLKKDRKPVRRAVSDRNYRRRQVRKTA